MSYSNLISKYKGTRQQKILIALKEAVQEFETDGSFVIIDGILSMLNEYEPCMECNDMVIPIKIHESYTDQMKPVILKLCGSCAVKHKLTSKGRCANKECEVFFKITSDSEFAYDDTEIGMDKLPCGYFCDYIGCKYSSNQDERIGVHLPCELKKLQNEKLYTVQSINEYVKLSRHYCAEHREKAFEYFQCHNPNHIEKAVISYPSGRENACFYDVEREYPPKKKRRLC